MRERFSADYIMSRSIMAGAVISVITYPVGGHKFSLEAGLFTFSVFTVAPFAKDSRNKTIEYVEKGKRFHAYLMIARTILESTETGILLGAFAGYRLAGVKGMIQGLVAGGIAGATVGSISTFYAVSKALTQEQFGQPST